LLDYKRLVLFFLKANHSLLSVNFKNSLAKNVLRLSAIVLSLLFVIYLKTL
jgi:hypothetical protein